MGTTVIIIVLIMVVFFSLKESMKHLKGEGGCCGGGDESKPEKKKLESAKVAEKIIHIEGMHCKNCKNSVEKQINKIDGAVAKVSLKKNLAVVVMSRIIGDEELKTAVEKADFKVTGIETKSI